MPAQTVTRSAEAELSPDAILKILTEPGNIPKWAPVFADDLEPIDHIRYRVRKDDKTFVIEVIVNEAAGTVDYLREMPNGNRGGAYIRVVPRPLSGCTVTMTVPIAPNTTESEVAETLIEELSQLIRLAQF